MEEWRERLLAARKRRGLGRAKLAEAAGVSVEAVRGYEVGRRHPRKPTLEALIRALDINRSDANAIREGAGFASVRTLFEDIPNYMYTLAELPAVLEESRWPAFVSNNSFEIVAANSKLRALWNVGPREALVDAKGLPGLNLLTLAFERRLHERISNWNDLVTGLAGMIRGRPINREPEFDVRSYLAERLPKLTADQRQLAAEMLQAWLLAPPITPKVRWRYRIEWHDPVVGVISFDCLVSPANESEALEFDEWIPVGAQSWERLQRLLPA